MKESLDSNSIESKEKPAFLYHGTTSFDVKKFEPRRRSTPGIYMDQEVPEAIYAGDDPAYCAAHSFPWSSNEGFQLGFIDGKVVFIVPDELKDRLNVKVYVYKMPSDAFEELGDVEPKGHNFWSKQIVTPTSYEEFNSVSEAIEHYGGEVRFE